MDDEYNIKINNEEGYSPEAIANFERSVEEFAETLFQSGVSKTGNNNSIYVV